MFNSPLIMNISDDSFLAPEGPLPTSVSTGVSQPGSSSFDKFCISNLSPLEDEEVKESRSVCDTKEVGKEDLSDLGFSAAVTKYERTKCKCRKSRCLKLYCECYASGNYCNRCECRFCHNTPLKYPRTDCIVPKIYSGCKCKKTHCRKKYCECFQNRISCSEYCTCTNCKNT